MSEFAVPIVSTVLVYFVIQYSLKIIFKFPEVKGDKPCIEGCLEMKYGSLVKFISVSVPLVFILAAITKNDMTNLSDISQSDVGLLFVFSTAMIITTLYAWKTNIMADERGIQKKTIFKKHRSLFWDDVSWVSIEDFSIKIWNKKGVGDILVSSQFSCFNEFVHLLIENVPLSKWSEEAAKLIPRNY